MLPGRRKVRFIKRASNQRQSRLREGHNDVDALRTATHSVIPTMASSTELPPWMLQNPIEDSFPTRSSDLAAETTEECRPLLVQDAATLPVLQREKHTKFLRWALGTLPSGFTSIDASRPWMCYWSLTALMLLGVDVSQYRYL